METENVRAHWHGVELSRRWPIFGSHVERIGLLRVLVGGGSMYLSIPLFLIFHVIGVALVLDRILTPLLGLPKTDTRDYIIIDRHQISTLPILDKFNCVFCAWANGLCVYINEKLGHIDQYAKTPGPYAKMIISLALVAFAPLFLVVQFIGIEIIYGVLVSRPLGMHRLSTAEARSRIVKTGFASDVGKPGDFALRIEKNFGLRLNNALEQIESSWCPLKHLDGRPECHYPDHHANFFEPDEVELMRSVLRNAGTVSDRKPYW